jgi:hypothetical protein
VKDPFPLGRPGDNTEAAARLFVKYRKEAPLSEDHARSFFLMCLDPAAVMARAAELLGKLA